MTLEKKILSIIKKIHGDKTVTISTESLTEIYDISNDGFVGYIPYHKVKMLKHIKEGVTTGAGIIIRQYTKVTKDIVTNKNKISKVPYKNIFGLLIHNGNLIPLNSEQVKQACCTCAQTGKILPKEEGVFYKNLILD